MQAWIRWGVLAALAAGFAAPADAGKSAIQGVKYDIDAAHSAVEFTIGFMGLTKVRGRFADYQGTLVYDAADPTRTSVTALIKTESIDTDNDFRDRHLRSPDFFDAEKHPWITFQSERFEKRGAELVMHGALNMHGVTKKIAVPVRVAHQEMLDAWGNRRVGFVGTLKLNRKEFGVEGGNFWNQTLDLERLAVSDEVEVTLNIQGRIANMDRMNYNSREKPSIGEAMQKTFEEKGIRAALEQYAAAHKSRPEEFNFAESELTKLGYRLLQHGKVDAAVAVFTLQRDRHSDSANAHDSLGEALAAKGDRAGAIAAYEKSLALEPNSTSAIEMLRRLRGEEGKLTLAGT